jgi:hypothetical protein
MCEVPRTTGASLPLAFVRLGAVMAYARALSRRIELGKAYDELTGSAGASTTPAAVAFPPLRQ